MSFTGPISNSELRKELSKLGVDLTPDQYFDLFIESMYSDEDDLPPEVLRENFKSLNFNLIEIVPDENLDPDHTYDQIPVSEFKGMADFCDRFYTGFQSQWGNWSFKTFDQQNEMCHAVNIAGAIVSLSVRKTDNYLVIVTSLDFPLAMMTDVLDDRIKIKFDFENATPEKKMEYFGPGLNIEHAREALLSARLKLQNE